METSVQTSGQAIAQPVQPVQPVQPAPPAPPAQPSPLAQPASPGSLTLRLLGPLAVQRGGVALVLPSSRKARALLAYLALAGHPVTRSHLCELLWDLPSDPRGELRWCLSKLRGVLDTPQQPRVVARGDSVALDLADCSVDARDMTQALQAGIAALPGADLHALAARFADGEFLESLDLPRSPAFSGWLLAQRRRLRAGQAALLDRHVQALPVGDAAAFPALERWLEITPFDRHAHALLLDALAATGRLREGEEHLAATARRYEAEGQDWAPIGHAWRGARLRHAHGLPIAGNGPITGTAVTTADTVSIAVSTAVSTVAAAGTDSPAWPSPTPAPGAPASPPRRASLAVMPFADRTPGAAFRGGLGGGLAHDVITRLARLRSMFVIAPGTVFALDERQVGAEDAGRRLDVDYVASGWMRREAGARLHVSVQLVETRSARVVWAEVFAGPLDDTFEVLDDIGNRIVASIADQIETAERDRAILKPPNSLNAWEAHHRGLWHAMRFNRADNEQARHFFQTAVRLDPTFARPYAGLSFTHFQDAFLGWRERAVAVEQAYRIASQGLMADDRDPTAHWAMGRSLWLKGRQDGCLDELVTAVDLSPNFALGHYTLAFVQAQSGDAQTAIVAADRARALSPFDPLLFGMLASRGMALMRLGRHGEAADWAVKAAARPNAHVHIQGIALYCLALAERHDEARAVAAAIRQLQPDYGLADVLQAYRFGAEGEALIREAAARLRHAV